MQGVETPQREDRMKSYDTSAFFIKSESTEGGAKEFCFFGGQSTLHSPPPSSHPFSPASAEAP